ncbi:Threonine/homoserine/homoserine lactone efflux protein [Methanolobus vulcani]|jgi:Putative threonine efflux protein|uniref:Threonine/homoserine/homoserine lactone efflux protein n=1 Tax=Methanolobus vulcani TaxID=38026 RepID=A0A7Z7FEK7_9EURY|nr:LysE family translocator [Methanolobus vulcani]SDF95279.1 Threonine/homoserine/homoserine lactone efflux protein [Methanolobus vulcani]
MFSINEFLISGILLGFASGISPGPLLAMTISESIQHGSRAGIKVALSPFITDLLIVSVILLFLLKFDKYDPVIAMISLVGSFYLIYLGISSLRTKNIDLELKTKKTNSLKKGIIVNFLSPHPYLFWITIGGPILFNALDLGISSSILFVAGFYALLVGSKIIIAILVGRSREFLKSNYYLYTIRSLGLVYMVFAFYFLKQAFELLN